MRRSVDWMETVIIQNGTASLAYGDVNILIDVPHSQSQW